MQWPVRRTHPRPTTSARPRALAQVCRARLFADRRESCLREPGDIVAPLQARRAHVPRPTQIATRAGPGHRSRLPGNAAGPAACSFCALQEGLIGEAHVQAELGELLAGKKPGRGSPSEVTLFESLGPPRDSSVLLLLRTFSASLLFSFSA